LGWRLFTTASSFSASENFEVLTSSFTFDICFITISFSVFHFFNASAASVKVGSVLTDSSARVMPSSSLPWDTAVLAFSRPAAASFLFDFLAVSSGAEVVVTVVFPSGSKGLFRLTIVSFALFDRNSTSTGTGFSSGTVNFIQ